ncbi:hypothetical protein [Microbacterium cremeum]|uniref:hypothetical protein n=1 Tax=Microbacterium cremeum TaxID=2782169 RepID=UPI0018884FDD|nr:hypothetical protein [Microbacterium cremeum]
MTTSSDRRSNGLVFVLGATVVAGLSGYAIQLLAAALLPDAGAYLSFSAFWSTMYLLGSAVGGVQQEVARATRPAVNAGPGQSLRPFTAVAALAALLAAAAVGLLLGPVAFGEGSESLTPPLIAGLLGYVLTSVATGLFYGTHRLTAVAALIVTDAVLRGCAVVVALLLGLPLEVVALAITLPFAIAVVAVWMAVRRSVVGSYALDVGTMRMARNAGHTVVAAAATGVMVTGMPLLFRIALADAPAATVASITLAVTLTRAPFIIPVMALQSFLTVRFRDAERETPRRLRHYLLLAAGVGVLAVGAGWFVGPWAVAWISNGQYGVSGVTSALVVASAVLVGCLCITGPALLARGRHAPYSAGWVVAAAATVALLFFLPAGPESRALFSLVAAPIAGLLVHLVAIARSTPAPG